MAKNIIKGDKVIITKGYSLNDGTSLYKKDAIYIINDKKTVKCTECGGSHTMLDIGLIASSRLAKSCNCSDKARESSLLIIERGDTHWIFQSHVNLVNEDAIYTEKYKAQVDLLRLFAEDKIDKLEFSRLNNFICGDEELKELGKIIMEKFK